MNKNFLKSLTTAIVGLTLVTSCAALKERELKKNNKNSCNSKKEESGKCSAAKAESKKVSQVKKAKKHIKSEIK